MHSSHSRRLFFIFPGVVFHVPVALAAISVQFSKAILSEIPNVRMIGLPLLIKRWISILNVSRQNYSYTRLQVSYVEFHRIRVHFMAS